jgi:hypothetical protein
MPYKAGVQLLGMANEYYASASQGYGYLPVGCSPGHQGRGAALPSDRRQSSRAT